MSVRASLDSTLRVDNSQTFTQRFSLVGSLTSGNGPSPGLVIATPAGTDIDLSLLDRPGPTGIINLSTTDDVEIGIWNADQSEFYPFLKIPANSGYPVWLSPNILQEYPTGTGTGTTGEQNSVRAKAMGITNVPIRFDCFDS